MIFNYESKGDVIHVSIVGKLDNEDAAELRNHLQTLLTEEFKEAVFNLTMVPFVASSAIGKFMMFFKDVLSKGRRMRIKGINEQLYELFHYIKLNQLFPIER